MANDEQPTLGDDLRGLARAVRVLVRAAFYHAGDRVLHALTTDAERHAAARTAVLAALDAGASSPVEMAGHASGTPAWGEFGLNLEAIVLAARELAAEGAIGRGCNDPNCPNCAAVRATDEQAPS